MPFDAGKKHTPLLHHIATFYGNKLSAAGVEEIVAELIARGVISIDDKGKVAYR